MKITFTMMAVLMSFACIAQSKILRPGIQYRKPIPVALFVDSTDKDIMLYLPFIDAKDIANLSVVNDDKSRVKYPNGVMYMTLKDHKILTDLVSDSLITLKQIADKHIPQADRARPLLYIVDDNLITDTTRIWVPSKHLFKVTLVKAAQLPYFKTALPDMLILMIATKPEQIYVR